MASSWTTPTHPASLIQLHDRRIDGRLVYPPPADRLQHLPLPEERRKHTALPVRAGRGVRVQVVCGVRLAKGQKKNKRRMMATNEVVVVVRECGLTGL